ncbi:hypothetical protein FRACYDRAFT_184503 [Fragilariopsis cylindrus CCMP1102]|uniref:Uncharacterized protein n=1 Tax=Fragilariopsis cylindrus CCMP1102 TaxID=635003 RepID=A0A1E7FGK0_9STRA|nr:hypothetical protein FRACYDRAFT_184503 [Fragilariopsis cylindrus CCMP1102]|eukprot:OEU17286.1 hypothetical protein FRACYDRAFT_184503 [Fragilariopsis cylindrus CCMP1102]
MKTTQSYYASGVLILVSIAAQTLAFVPIDNQHNKISIRTSVIDVTTTTTKLQVLWDPLNEIEHDVGLVEFPTDKQRMAIKKEAKQRKSRKQLPYFSLSEEEMNGEWSDETFSTVWKQLTETEMMEIKGVCRTDRRAVFRQAKLFCEELEDMISSLPVALISTKGHTALIFCPTLPQEHPDKFILRTSVGQKNVWRSRPKALRDNRGQIIKE